MPIYLFVYGTLRRGEPTEFACRLASEARFAGTATVRGRLYCLPRYPAMVRSDDGLVHGDLFENVPEDLLRDLDVYEGSEYRREMIEVKTANGELIEAWTYVFTDSVEHLPVISSGDWLQHKLPLHDETFGG